MFQNIDPKTLTENVFSLLGETWLITAGDEAHCNPMTAGWGGLGILWTQPVVSIFVRPQRYTYELLEKYPEFTLSFFDEQYRPQLALCGSKSGRDMDKFKECGFTKAMAGETAPYIEEARLVLVCQKLYAQDLDPACFVAPSLAGFYEQRDYHRMYVGGITQVLRRV